MPIISSLTAITAKVYGLLSSLVVKIQDTFNRTDSPSSLGTSTTGQIWTNTRGTWGISGNVATTANAGSTYPLASVLAGKPNNTVSVNITNGGPGVAFWVTDANSWWASSVDYNSTSSTTSYQFTGCCGGVGPKVSADTTCSCGSLTSSTTYFCYTSTPTSSTSCYCNAPSFYQNGQCYVYVNGTAYVSGETPTCTTTYGSTCSPSNLSTYSYNPGSCDCGVSSSTSYRCSSTLDTCTGYTTTTTYYTTLKLYSSVSGTVAVQSSLQLASSTSSYQTADKIQAGTNNNSITVRGYSGASQLGGTLSFTAVSPTKGPRVGIIKTPAQDNIGSSVDNFLSLSD